MTNSKHTLIFAGFVFASYCVGYHIASQTFPSALWLEIFPWWLMGLGFAFVTLPAACIHCRIVGYVARKRNTGDISSLRSVVMFLLLSTIVALPLAAGFAWLSLANLNHSFPNIDANMIAPTGPAFRQFNAVMTILLRNTLPLILAAWGSTIVLLKSMNGDHHRTKSGASSQPRMDSQIQIT